MNESERPNWAMVLDSLFAHQIELMSRFKDIERLPDPPVPLHTPNGQRILKDFAWRVVEEMTESYEEWTGIRSDRAKATEELADALHFLVELMIFAGITPRNCLAYIPYFPDLRPGVYLQRLSIYWNATHTLGLAMNCLRNRPWKQTQVPTNEALFRERLLAAFEAHLQIWGCAGLDHNELLAAYLQKNEINTQRIEEGV